MKEQWRKVLNGDYEVSNRGGFRRAKPGRRTWIGRPVIPVMMKIGYLCVSPTIDGKNRTMYLHRLVAEAFLGPCPAGCEVNHIDGNKANPDAVNLEYISHRENSKHASRNGLLRIGENHPSAKLADADVLAIRTMFAGGARNGALAKRFDVSPSTITEITHGTKRRAS